ncbi:hypothetical protein Chor_002377 [Crotalus horridus]
MWFFFCVGKEAEWLIRYGYLPPADSTTGQLQTWEDVATALRMMQRFAGIAETGILGKDKEEEMAEEKKSEETQR